MRELEENLQALDYNLTTYISYQTTVDMNQIHISCMTAMWKNHLRSVKEFVNLKKNTPLPVQMDRFWACPKNKQNLQLISRTFFQQKSTVCSARIILSSFISDEDGISQGVESNDGKLFPILDLCSSI